MAYRLYVFDAYGTLFDVAAAVMRYATAIGPDARQLAELWRLKQLEYSWVRTLMGRTADFWTLTEQSLDYAAARFGGLAPGLRAQLLASYAELDPYPDAKPTLQALRSEGLQTAILSNGSTAMLASAVAAAGLEPHLDACLSVEAIGVFKTHRRAYGLVTERFDTPPSEIAFVSSNRWDAAGAAAFGFDAFWINRAGLPDEYDDLPPVATLTSLRDLPGLDGHIASA